MNGYEPRFALTLLVASLVAAPQPGRAGKKTDTTVRPNRGKTAHGNPIGRRTGQRKTNLVKSTAKKGKTSLRRRSSSKKLKPVRLEATIGNEPFFLAGGTLAFDAASSQWNLQGAPNSRGASEPTFLHVLEAEASHFIDGRDTDGQVVIRSIEKRGERYLVRGEFAYSTSAGPGGESERRTLPLSVSVDPVSFKTRRIKGSPHRLSQRAERVVARRLKASKKKLVRTFRVDGDGSSYFLVQAASRGAKGASGSSLAIVDSKGNDLTGGARPGEITKVLDAVDAFAEASGLAVSFNGISMRHNSDARELTFLCTPKKGQPFFQQQLIFELTDRGSIKPIFDTADHLTGAGVTF